MHTAIDDDDLGSLFRAKREASQAKRADNRTFSTNLLRERGVFFTEHNRGAHLIVMDKWDFWPGTGKWAERKGRAGHAKRQGRGVRELLALIAREDGNGA